MDEAALVGGLGGFVVGLRGARMGGVDSAISRGGVQSCEIGVGASETGQHISKIYRPRI